MLTRRKALGALAAAAWTRPAKATTADWPQFRGPHRDGVSAETGLLGEWPSNGPKKLWSARGLGAGYGSAAIAGDHIYIQGGIKGQSVVHCLERAGGKILWTTPLGALGSSDRGDGPRSTPTVEGGFLYAMSENGDLACLRLKDGGVVWKRNVLSDFRGSNPYWLLSESPLLDGGNVIVTPGGRNAGIVALNKATGATVWQARELSDSAGYASCVIADIGPGASPGPDRVRTVMQFTAEAGVGVRASDGKLMWRNERAANDTANCASPVYAEGKVFYSSAYGAGGALLWLSVKDGLVSAREGWFTRDMMNHHGGVIHVRGCLYGYSNSILTCIDLETGKTLWRDRSVGKGSLTYAADRLYLLSEGNVMGLAEASPKGYREKGRFRLQDQGWPSWSYPVVCGGILWIRNQGVLEAYGIKA
jgi:outer membrane protein assembly factor BamB